MTDHGEQPPLAVTQREIQEILRTFARSGWRSMHLEVQGMRISVGRDGPPSVPTAQPTGRTEPAVAAPDAPAASPSSSAPAAPADPVAEPNEPVAPTSNAQPADGSGPSAPATDTTGLVEVRSPAVGAFWVAPSPGSPPFVEVGQVVEADEQLAIVEVMKLMNAVVAPQAGEVAQVCAANAEMVEYDQVLFRLRPTTEESSADPNRA